MLLYALFFKDNDENTKQKKRKGEEGEVSHEIGNLFTHFMQTIIVNTNK